MKRILLPLLLLLAALSARAQTTTVSVDNVAALVALSPSGLSAVNLLGHDSPGDGGGGLLYLTNTWTGTNLVTRYASATTNWSWQRAVSKPLNPRWAGAKGDFTTDDTAAFQACLDWVDPNIGNTNQSMLSIRVDDGWYSISSVTNRQPSELYGLVKTKGVFSTSAPGLFQRVGASGPLLYSAKRMIIRDLQFYGRASSNLRNDNTITTVSNRFNFSVATTNNVPTSTPLAYYPYGGVCLFYTTNNTLVGSGIVTAVTGGTNITLAPNYDWYATDSGSNLTTGWKVCFTPWTAWTNAYGQSPIGPSAGANAPTSGEIGLPGIELAATQNSIVEHCSMSGFTVGLYLKGCAEVRVQDCDFYACHLASIWGDNLFDSVIDRVQAQAQQLYTGAFPDEYAGVDGDGKLYGRPAITDIPAQNSFYCQGRCVIGGWNWNNNVGHHWFLDYGTVGVNLSGQGPYMAVALSDATIDNTAREVMVLDHNGYFRWDWLSHSSVGGTILSLQPAPAILALDKASFAGDTMEISAVGGATNQLAFAADVTQSTPVKPPTLGNLILNPNSPSVLTNNAVPFNGNVYVVSTTGTSAFGNDVSVTGNVAVTGNLTTTGNMTDVGSFTARPATGKNLAVTAGTGVDVSAADNAGTTYVPLKLKASSVTQNDGTRDLLATARNTGASIDYQIHGTGSTPTLSWTDAGLIGWGDYTSATSALNAPFQWRVNGMNLKLSTNYLAGTTVPTIRLSASDDSFGPRPFKFQALSHNFTTDSDTSYVLVLTNDTATVNGPLTANGAVTVNSSVTTTGAVRVPAGSGTVSAIGPSADFGTGLSFPGAGVVNFLGGGAVVGAINSNGHLLVGTGTDNGTGNPVQAMVSGGNGTFDMTVYGGDAGSIYRLASGTVGSPGPTSSGQIARALVASGTTNGTAWVSGARVEAVATRAWDTSGYGMRLGFHVTPNAVVGSTVEALRIDQDSSVQALVGDVKINAAGKGLAVKYGTNCKLGSFTLSGGTATVSNTSITANSVVFFTLTSASGTVGIAPYVSSVTAGTSFSVQAGGSDTSTYKYFIVEAQ